jgi:hypothetical protein
MRAAVVTLAVLLVAVGASAEPAPPPPPAGEPASAAPAPPPPPAGGPIRLEGAARDPASVPPTDLDTQPPGTKRPSGFWTGYRPARGGAYRWPLLGVAVVVLAGTALLVLRLLRRASRQPRPGQAAFGRGPARADRATSS